MRPDPAAGRCRIVAAMAARMRYPDAFGHGPLAELRRLDPDGPLAEPALHRLLARHGVRESALDGAGLVRWGLVVHVCALAAPKLVSPHREPEAPDVGETFWADEARQAQRRLGRALFESDYSERRFVNLIDAGPDALLVALPRAVRFLVTRGGRLPVMAAADLVFSAEEADEGWGRTVRRRIARGYYGAEQGAGQGARQGRQDEKPEGRAS